MRALRQHFGDLLITRIPIFLNEALWRIFHISCIMLDNEALCELSLSSKMLMCRKLFTHFREEPFIISVEHLFNFAEREMPY